MILVTVRTFAITSTGEYFGSIKHHPCMYLRARVCVSFASFRLFSFYVRDVVKRCSQLLSKKKNNTNNYSREKRGCEEVQRVIKFNSAATANRALFARRV